MPIKLDIGDVVELKKQHPCGNNKFEIARTGMDFRIICTECKKHVWLSRNKLEKRIRKLTPKDSV